MFGHFYIRHGKPKRSNPGTQKVWVLLFSCLYTRAIHLEILDSMDTSSFKLAFQRFQAIRGVCAYLHSDEGSSFMGARNEKSDLSDDTIQEVKNIWKQHGKHWDVNPLLASHFGGYGNVHSVKLGTSSTDIYSQRNNAHSGAKSSTRCGFTALKL